MSIREDYTGEYSDEEVSDSLVMAEDALETVYVLQEAADKSVDGEYSVTEQKTLDVAIESFFTKHPEFKLALESIDDGTPPRTTGERIKKTIDYLFAIAKNILTFFVDYIGSNKRKAVNYIARTKEYIGRADGLSTHSSISIASRSVVNNLHADGIQPVGIDNLYAKLVKSCIDQRQFLGLNDISSAVMTARKGDLEATRESVEKLRGIYESGFTTSTSQTSTPRRSFAFNEVREDCKYFVSEPYFGAMHVTGYISEEVRQDGSFLINTAIKANPEVPLRVSSFEALQSQEIITICRSIQKFCQSVVSNSQDETTLARLLREASFISSSKVELTTVLALRSITSVSKGPYLAYHKLAMSTTKNLLNYCQLSLEAVEKLNTEGSIHE